MKILVTDQAGVEHELERTRRVAADREIRVLAEHDVVVVELAPRVEAFGEAVAGFDESTRERFFWRNGAELLGLA